MGDDESPDKVIREREFRLPSGIDIGNLDVSENVDDSKKAQKQDDAIGDLFDPFAEPDEDSPGRVSRDGSVSSPPERDIVSQLSTEGEQRVNWILMVSMIVIYSAISIQIGRVFEAQIGTILLLFLAFFGFGLGELWVPKERLSLLGITWVIISMKVLYGLAIELRNWGVIEDDLWLGIVLLLLVVVNILVAYRHDHDAIAAQSTLVLLAIGSTAGTEFGELGVAVMILIATIILHGIAINRGSGNLASLGIASSNLWIGMHAITPQFSAGPLQVLPIEEPLLLFLLLMVVTSLNAYMATVFSKNENWFSKGFETLGLGKPGLWGVSISLGMVGAVLAVASNREDLGYALGMVTFLGGAFCGSYLVVRGVQSRRVSRPLLITATVLTLVLLNDGYVDESLGVSSYQIFTAIGAVVTVAIILRDQSSVSDRVLWVGSVAVLAILVLLVPTDSKSDGDGGFTLLGILSLLHIGTAVLAVRRNSSSLTGVTVILPWSWIVTEKMIEETVRTIMIANDLNEHNGMVHLEPLPLAIYLSLSSVLLFLVNSKMGDSGVNLASGFLGITEISASIRDSGLLNLWSIGLWLPMLTIVILAQFDGFNTLSLVSLLALVSFLHILSFALGLRNSSEEGIIWIVAITYLTIQWRHGLDESIFVLMCLSISSILYFGKDAVYGLGIGMVAVPMLVFWTGRDPSRGLSSPKWISDLDSGVFSGTLFDTEFLAVACTIVVLSVYLPRAEYMENMLRPACSALVLVVISSILSLESDNALLQFSSAMVFIFTSFWLISRGEIRSELKTIAKRETVISMVSEGVLSPSLGPLSSYSPKVAEMEQLRRSKRELSDTEDISELLSSEITHTPVVGMVILMIVLLSGILGSAVLGMGPLILVSTGVFCCATVFLIKKRTKGLELDLPHILGIEMPIALSVTGVCLILLSAHVFPPGSSPRLLLDMAVACSLILVLLMVSLLEHKNLIDRISIAIDWFVIPLLLTRLIGGALVGALPLPFTVEPFDGDNLEWTMPWLLLESILVLCVILGFWIEGKRSNVSSREMDGFGSGARSLAIVMMSFGPAGILAASSSAVQSVRTSRPSELGIALPSGVLAIFALSRWNESLLDWFGEILLISGIVVMIGCAFTVVLRLPKWTFTLAANGHIFVISGAITVGMVGNFGLPVLMILMSTEIWIIGILQLRKGFRIWGLADLVAAIVCFLVFASGDIGQSEILLGMTVLAVELGVVAWLGLVNQDELLKD
ncbi:MAG: hypothetical protein CM15mP6_2750 [Methanobacteriota archaeon]|nr:MAG: hypothetical protein CM15mP6_2750 [Euryarchaeota archaeon]